MPSQEFNALKSAIVSFPEANSQSIFANQQTIAQGLYLTPTPGVSNRPSDITGYILKATNEDGKLEWALPSQGQNVQGIGSIWFSDITGNAEGDQLNLYWNDSTKKLAVGLNGAEPEYTIDSLGGIQTDVLYLKNNNSNIGIQCPPIQNSYELVLPEDTGSIGQVLATDGNGNLAWVNNGTGGGGNVPGEGTIWFSDIFGNPTGNTADFNWDGTALNIVGNNNVSGLITALNFKALSDVSLKKNVKPIQNPLQTIQKIDGFSYQWNDPHLTQQTQLGVIAQELEKNGLNSLVDSTGNYKLVDYNQIIPLLVEAVKELSNKLN